MVARKILSKQTGRSTDSDVIHMDVTVNLEYVSIFKQRCSKSVLSQALHEIISEAWHGCWEPSTHQYDIWLGPICSACIGYARCTLAVKLEAPPWQPQ
ncbi:hypothetical protein BDR04DRAFT_752654 [Suillus decipiens]|nr:hypothetical protein BDR04DRAFT_752654 [Suillus decipiens]